MAALSSPITMVTLRDETQVPQKLLKITTLNLQALGKESSIALFELFQKCKDSCYKFDADPKAILKKWAFIDASEKVHDLVKSIVLNSLELKDLSIKLINPIKGTSELPLVFFDL